ncbi:uncharacterized protein LOC127253027 isoform X2 [Andrographis paniculata]|uniref:uncharacterized protein LOC127253027 isoform X2 n=1 Tax=Andrographis paniculata TaxID=175694 RepID=UPI0021E9A0E0|nr:uncharacterized protein LOC127253027 isoform X2 [Andrographis paniculata]
MKRDDEYDDDSEKSKQTRIRNKTDVVRKVNGKRVLIILSCCRLTCLEFLKTNDALLKMGADWNSLIPAHPSCVCICQHSLPRLGRWSLTKNKYDKAVEIDIKED